MSQDEITAIMKAKHEIDKISWEQTRTLSFYTIAAQQGTKHIKSPKELFALPWDEGNKDKPISKALTRDEFLNKSKLIR
jgi:hypothetical protein